jgi:hypothetical protein
MNTDVIWRMKQKMELRRCFQLRFANAPVSERYPEAYKRVAAQFAADMSRFRDEWTNFEHSSTPLVWRDGPIAIRYHFLSPHRIVEVLSVKLEAEPADSGLNPSTNPKLASGTSRAKHNPRSG